jgi:hypothetical protein
LKKKCKIRPIQEKSQVGADSDQKHKKKTHSLRLAKTFCCFKAVAALKKTTWPQVVG